METIDNSTIIHALCYPSGFVVPLIWIWTLILHNVQNIIIISFVMNILYFYVHSNISMYFRYILHNNNYIRYYQEYLYMF